VGFDDLELGELLPVPLTVVGYHAAELRRQGAELVGRRLDGDG
jgi:DNA-binding LacI/PurR family transcriptional regulator